jgi:hypothetical protein
MYASCAVFHAAYSIREHDKAMNKIADKAFATAARRVSIERPRRSSRCSAVSPARFT